MIKNYKNHSSDHLHGRPSLCYDHGSHGLLSERGGAYRHSRQDAFRHICASAISDSRRRSYPLGGQAELAEARAKNPDTVAWLYIPGAEVDDPVMQAEDNGYYLNRDELREYSTWGCYYADCRNHLSGRDALDTNTVIYGHSANDCDPDGVRFTKLHRYMDADFVKENPYIYLSVDGDDLIFQITALFITDTGFDYIDPNPMGSKLTDFFQTVERKNWLDFDGVTFSEEDTVLTLSTCCRKYDKANSGNQRLVVMAKLLPEGATAQEFSVSLVDDPEMS